MKIFNYLKERLVFILASLFVILFIIFILLGLKVKSYAVFLICMLIVVLNTSFLAVDFIKKNRVIKEVFQKLDSLDEKYLLSEVMEKPEDQYNLMLFRALKMCNKSMVDHVSKLERENNEFKEFIELWVHEVKTPIASSKLIIDNNKNNVTLNIKEEIERIEDSIEKALYYSRSSTLEKDFIIKNQNLDKIVNSAIKRDAPSLIENRVSIEKENLDYFVFADEKWLEFIIHQIISNSIKYFDKKEKKLVFTAYEVKDNIILSIKDNGIGMNERTVLKAFDKGFTGETGRIFKSSTGIGLYLCRKLCLKMDLRIKLNSKEGEFTEVLILFPKTKMMTFS